MAYQDISCIDVLKETWPSFQDNLKVTLGIPAVLVTVPMAVVGIPAGIIALIAALSAAATKLPMMPMLVVIGVGTCVCFAVAYNAVRAGWTVAILALAANEEATFSDIKMGMPWFVNFLLVNLIIGVATTAGGFLFIVPGIFVAVRASFAPFLVIDEDLGPIEAIMKSNELVTGCSWQVLLYHVLYGLANFVGGFIPFVGAIPVMGYFDLALGRMYLLRK